MRCPISYYANCYRESDSCPGTRVLIGMAVVDESPEVATTVAPSGPYRYY